MKGFISTSNVIFYSLWQLTDVNVKGTHAELQGWLPVWERNRAVFLCRSYPKKLGVSSQFTQPVLYPDGAHSLQHSSLQPSHKGWMIPAEAPDLHSVCANHSHHLRSFYTELFYLPQNSWVGQVTISIFQWKLRYRYSSSFPSNSSPIDDHHLAASSMAARLLPQLGHCLIFAQLLLSPYVKKG